MYVKIGKSMSEARKILQVKNLTVSFRTENGSMQVIRGVNFDLNKGETLAIVGESGSGKSVTIKTIMGIIDKNEKIDSGEILYTFEDENGNETTVDLSKYSKQKIVREICGQRIAMVFQDPMTSLNPVIPIGKQVMEGMIAHHKIPKKEAYERAVDMLDSVGIVSPEERMKDYPHQLSGGMRQRVVIAIALACDPEILICDEPTTALDVTIQARILELIQKMQRERNLSIIYITHDLGVVAKVADKVAVMYAGKFIEVGTAEEVFYDPRHPYTWGLLSAIPDIGATSQRLYTIPGSPPDLTKPIVGDAFSVRNQFALKIDYEEEPPMFKISDTHYAATWLMHPNAPEVHMPEQLSHRIEKTLESR